MPKLSMWMLPNLLIAASSALAQAPPLQAPPVAVNAAASTVAAETTEAEVRKVDLNAGKIGKNVHLSWPCWRKVCWIEPSHKAPSVPQLNSQ